MPNHVHAVVWPYTGRTLSRILHSWKSYTAGAVNKLVRRTGQPFWQKESYDHLIRDDVERARLCAYVVNNPVKSRLCTRPEDWAWSSANPMSVRFSRQKTNTRLEAAITGNQG